MLVNIIVLLILVFSFIGGMAQGAVKSFFSLIAFICSVWLTGLCYHLLAGLLSFLGGEYWENFLGFLITLAIISIILHLLLFLPRFIINKLWFIKGPAFRILGGVFSLFNSAIGMTVFTLLVTAYPVTQWLVNAVLGSSVLVWLVHLLGFVEVLIPGLAGSSQIATLIPLLPC